MPLDQSYCDGCGGWEMQCPECNGTHVTPRDTPYIPSPNQVVNLGHEHEHRLEYTHVCWDCGWQETVILTVRREGR